MANAITNFGSKGGMGILVVLTITTEEVASFLMFECPCDNSHFIYGLAYLFGPAAILFLAALLAQTRFWRLVTGLFRRKRIMYKFREEKEESCLSSMWAFQKAFAKCIVRALPCATAWVLIGLLKV